MTRRQRGAIVALALWGGPAATLAAAERFSVAFEGGLQKLSATNSAKAVFDGSDGGKTLGGSLRFSLHPNVFVGAGLRTFEKNGERVFVDPPGPVFPLGHPLEVRLRSVYGLAGVRLFADSPLVPYVAVGAGKTRYEEESTVAGLRESEEASKFSWRVMAGADFAPAALHGLGLGVEASWSSAKDLVGLGGVSKLYAENDLGGFSIVGRLSLRR